MANATVDLIVLL